MERSNSLRVEGVCKVLNQLLGILVDLKAMHASAKSEMSLEKETRMKLSLRHSSENQIWSDYS